MAEREESSNKLMGWLSARFSNGADAAAVSDFEQKLKNAAELDIIDQDVIDIIYGAMQVSKLHARDVMVPRTKMACLSVDDSINDILMQPTEKRHTRFPVIGEDMDDIRGVLHTKDLLEALIRGTDHNDIEIRDYMRPITFIPESKRLYSLFQEFRLTRRHMAIVVDEFSHVSGLITAEDVLEQIVGDIEDEHDMAEDSDPITQVDDTTFRIDAATTIEEFNEQLEAELPTDEFDTIGGIVVNHFGHLPEPKESIAIGEHEFTVINADSRRVHVLNVIRLVK